MKKLFAILSLSILISLSVTTSSFAQGESVKTTGAKPKTISKADRAVIIEILATLDAQYYRLELNGGLYGKLLISPGKLMNIKAGASFSGIDQHIIGLYKELGLLYVIKKTSPDSDLETALGKQNASRLNAVIKKYTGGSDN